MVVVAVRDQHGIQPRHIGGGDRELDHHRHVESTQQRIDHQRRAAAVDQEPGHAQPPQHGRVCWLRTPRRRTVGSRGLGPDAAWLDLIARVDTNELPPMFECTTHGGVDLGDLRITSESSAEMSGFDCLARQARSARIALWNPPPPSSLAEERTPPLPPSPNGGARSGHRCLSRTAVQRPYSDVGEADAPADTAATTVTTRRRTNEWRPASA